MAVTDEVKRVSMTHLLQYHTAYPSVQDLFNVAQRMKRLLYMQMMHKLIKTSSN